MKRLILIICAFLFLLSAYGQETMVWKAKWIEPGFNDEKGLHSCPVFEKKIELGKKVKSARIYMTAHGVYEASLNGRRVSDHYFAPGWTSYAKRLQYQAYEVGPLLSRGENTLQVTIGNGWYRGMLGFEGKRDFYGNRAALLLQLEIVYADGSKELVVSDDSWRSGKGSIVYSDMYTGELIDGRKSLGDWKGVVMANYPFDNLVSTVSPAVRKQERFKAVKVWRNASGELLADFGQNLVGFVRLELSGKAGDTVSVEHAEVLDAVGNFYTQNLRKARQQDKYILSGNGREVFEPHFTFHGFRYVRLKGIDDILPEQLEAVALYSDLPKTGGFECSDPLLNQLQKNIVWTRNGNLLEIPTDCPQRDERMGWLADAQTFSRTAMFLNKSDDFFYKWLADIRADQLPDGNVPFVVPNILGPAAGAAGWSDAAVILPWNLYQVYGDKAFLQVQYPSMKAWVTYLNKNTSKGLRRPAFQFGDWLSYKTYDPASADRTALTSTEIVAQAYYIHALDLTIQTAGVLGKRADVEDLSVALLAAKAAFMNEYVTPAGRLMSDTQAAYTLALAFDVLPEHMRAQTAKLLADNVKSYNGHLTTGILATNYLPHVLVRFGYGDLAYRMLLQKDFPGWLYPISKGATTIWERWDGIKPDGSFQNATMNSFNHYAFGAIGDWMYQHILGIQVGEPGYKKIIIKPLLGGNLTWAKGAYHSGYGKIAVDWKKRDDGKVSLTVEVPKGTTAEVYVPNGDGTLSFKKELSAGRHQLESK